jgi:arsenite methyltransferase
LPAEVKACCAAAYGNGAARWLLGEHLHPGGAALTSELAAALAVGRGSVVADVACGPGAGSLQLAQETGCDVVGIDISTESLAVARGQAEAAGLAARVEFVEGDAEALPLEDGSVDGALCECAVCTFPDKPAAARELARVLRPGGRLALSDMTAEPERLPAELRTLHAWVACLADARPLPELAELLEGAGFSVERSERRDHDLAVLLERLDGRLRLARVLGAVDGAALGFGFELLGAARRALADGSVGYGVVIAAA